MPKTNRPTITTHVLDTSRGEPAAGVAVSLWRLDGTGRADPRGKGETDADGRIEDLVTGPLVAGTYRLTFDVGPYFKRKGDKTAFLGQVTLDFEIADTRRRYHIPLLVSPYGYTTYRGS